MINYSIIFEIGELHVLLIPILLLSTCIFSISFLGFSILKMLESNTTNFPNPSSQKLMRKHIKILLNPLNNFFELIWEYLIFFYREIYYSKCNVERLMYCNSMEHRCKNSHNKIETIWSFIVDFEECYEMFEIKIVDLKSTNWKIYSWNTPASLVLKKCKTAYNLYSRMRVISLLVFRFHALRILENVVINFARHN